MSTRLVLVVSLIASVVAVAACGTDSSTNSSSDGGADATSGVDASALDATADAGPNGCQRCVVGSSTVGNCCLQ